MNFITRISLKNRPLFLLPYRTSLFFCSKKPPKGFENFERKTKKSGMAPLREDLNEPKVEAPIQPPQPQTLQPEEVKHREEEENQGKQNTEQKTQEKPKQDKGKSPTPQPPDFNRLLLTSIVSSGVLLVALSLLSWDEHLSDRVLISTTHQKEFQRQYLDQDKVKSIKLSQYDSETTPSYSAKIHLKDGGSISMVIKDPNTFLESLEKNQLDRGKTLQEMIPVTYHDGTYHFVTVDKLLKLIIVGSFAFIAYGTFRIMQKQMKGMGTVTFSQYEEKVKIRFADVAGLNEAKVEITEFVEFLKKPQRFKAIGAKIPRGALLTGPPGTGKTMLAKACAGEAGVPFFYVSGSDFVEMFVGVGAGRVRDLFAQAKKKAPSIIFIDEIDAVGKKRGSSARNDERDNTLNQLLVEMDGFGTDTNVIILAATNRKDMLDAALLRPGRFDRSIDITLPDIEGRKQVFMVHLKALKLDEAKSLEEYAKRLATLTPGFSGAQIANICNEAAILAARSGKKTVDSESFERATERVLGGLEKAVSLSAEERSTIAYHESGHAVVSWFLEGGHPLLKLTIIARSKGTLGFSQFLPNESTLQTKEELIDQIACILGGRCAEQHFFNRITTGAQDDLAKAWGMANRMVTHFGMSEKIGYISLAESTSSRAHSDQTLEIVDAEIRALITEATTKAQQVIKEKEHLIKKLSETLLEQETINLKTLVEILGPRPFPAKSNYKEYLKITEALALNNN